jgi:hypothetical protein
LKEYDELFQLGLKHVPTPKDTSNDELDTSFESFKHKVGWNYFMDKQHRVNDEFNPAFRTKAAPFHFSGIYKKPLDELQPIQDKLNDFKSKDTPVTSKRKEIKLLQELKKDPSLFWTPSDKNLGLTCLNTLDYHQLVMNHLNQDSYKKLGSCNVNKFFDTNYQRTKQQFLHLVETIMIPYETEKGNNQIVKYLKEQFKHGTMNEFSYPAFHVLPKLHKGLSNLTSRPVVGAVDWFTTPVSKILSFHLQKSTQLKNQSHLLKRTTDAIDRLKTLKRNDLGNDSILVTMDIESLYTSIDLSILNEILLHIDPYLQNLCSFINSQNKFEYLGSIYQQDNGIAMGTNAAPEMANLYLLALLDTQMLQIPEIKGYSRYLDDLFFVWNGSESRLNRLFEKLQVLIPGIKFTCQTSKKEIDFLDLHILMDNSQIHHYTHQKLLNKYAYITPKSSHPSHVFKGWIQAELNRYKNNSSRRIYYERTKELFYQRLCDRGYPRRFLNSIFKKHFYVFLVTPPKPKEKTLPFIIRYSKRNGLTTLGQIVHVNPLLKELLPQHKFLTSWKKSPSIKDILCPSRLSQAQTDLINQSVSGNE